MINFSKIFSHRKLSGISLIELLVTVFILSVGIVSTMLFFSNAMISADFARDITTATSHAEYLMEEMQSRSSLFDIINTDWQQWAQTEKLLTLPDEVITVNFPASNTKPLEIEVIVAWNKRAKTNTVSFKTAVIR